MGLSCRRCRCNGCRRCRCNRCRCRCSRCHYCRCACVAVAVLRCVGVLPWALGVFVGPPSAFVGLHLTGGGGIQRGPGGVSAQPMCQVLGGISEGSSVVGGVVLTAGLVGMVASCGVETRWPRVSLWGSGGLGVGTACVGLVGVGGVLWCGGVAVRTWFGGSWGRWGWVLLSCGGPGMVRGSWGRQLGPTECC